jgi:cellulose synthase/poly-beta-1,6-N-acetylglucosamine synthase-like glycosyltransferase
MELLFWIACGVIAYVYAGYPALLAVWARIAPRPCDEARGNPITPAVSIVVAARNEAAALVQRIENLLALDYPSELVQIVVVSDGSTDGTKDILERYADRVDAVLLPPGGKAIALNAGVAATRHGIIVFSDARQSFASDALSALVAPFADPKVGGVSGELVLDCESGDGTSNISEGVGAYWRYEKWLRRQESVIGSTLGATGAIYALRRSLWRPLPADTILDDVLAPMRAVLAGYRVIFEARARAYDRAAAADAEFRRKTRTLAGNYQLLRLEPRLLLPIVNPVWCQFVSHKLGRLVIPWALGAVFIASAFLAPSSPVYAAALVAQLLLYGLALRAATLRQGSGSPRASRGANSKQRTATRDARLARIAYAFVMMNAAAVTGLVAVTFGKRVWR